MKQLSIKFYTWRKIPKRNKCSIFMQLRLGSDLMMLYMRRYILLIITNQLSTKMYIWRKMFKHNKCSIFCAIASDVMMLYIRIYILLITMKQLSTKIQNYKCSIFIQLPLGLDLIFKTLLISSYATRILLPTYVCFWHWQERRLVIAVVVSYQYR